MRFREKAGQHEVAVLAWATVRATHCEHAEAHQVCQLHSSVVHPWSESSLGAAGRSSVELMASFPSERSAPGRARRMLVAALEQAGCGQTLVQDAALIVTEMATNVVLHVGSPFSISARLQDETLHIAVRDAGPLAAMGDRVSITRRGHGLGFIDTMSARWGAEAAPDGKVVWAELRL
jgi:anti-sigma regulatory factor (Ser/Thr protein kinase)